MKARTVPGPNAIPTPAARVAARRRPNSGCARCNRGSVRGAMRVFTVLLDPQAPNGDDQEDLAARRVPEVRLSVDLSPSEGLDPEWTYNLAFAKEPAGSHSPVITEEVVERRGMVVLRRPDDADTDDRSGSRRPTWSRYPRTRSSGRSQSSSGRSATYTSCRNSSGSPKSSSVDVRDRMKRHSASDFLST